MPDSWHAQAVSGVDLNRRVIHVANPSRYLSEAELVMGLPCRPLIHIRASEVLFHCKDMTNAEIEQVVWPSEDWQNLEVPVTKQILDLREKFPGDSWMEAGGRAVTIPYAGTGDGVGPTLRFFAVKGSKAADRILAARDETFKMPTEDSED